MWGSSVVLGMYNLSRPSESHFFLHLFTAPKPMPTNVEIISCFNPSSSETSTDNFTYATLSLVWYEPLPKIPDPADLETVVHATKLNLTFEHRCKISIKYFLVRFFHDHFATAIALSVVLRLHLTVSGLALWRIFSTKVQ